MNSAEEKTVKLEEIATETTKNEKLREKSMSRPSGKGVRGDSKSLTGR